MSTESNSNPQDNLSEDNSEEKKIADSEIENKQQEDIEKEVLASTEEKQGKISAVTDSDAAVESESNEQDENPIAKNETVLEAADSIIEGQAEEKQISMQQAATDEEEAVDTSDTVPRIIGFSVIILVFGFLMGWSYMAPLDSAAYAPGFVTVESYRKTIQHLEGGIVKEIKTKDGQLVNKGDLLIVLDDTQLRAQLEIYESQYIAALALSDRLEAERDKLAEIHFDKYLIEKKSDINIEKTIRIQKQVFKTRKAAREGETDVLKQRIEQLREQVSGLKEQQKSDNKQIQLYREEIVEFKALLKKGFTDKTRMRDMQRRVAQLEGEVAKTSSNISASKIKMGETKLEIIQIENKHQLEVAELLSQTSAKKNDLQERRLAIQDKLIRTKIVAQDAGMVLGMTVHTIGGVISQGKPILEIVPQGENLIIEAQVSPVDIDKVHKGLISEVRFSAFKSATTPIIEGEVISVSADSLTDSNTGMPYYLARIKVTPDGHENLGDLTLLPGMPADTLIKVGERTLFEYLVQPATNAFARSFIED